MAVHLKISSVANQHSEALLMKPSATQTPPRSDKKASAHFSFSANRRLASHKVRYIETNVTSDRCTLCDLDKVK